MLHHDPAAPRVVERRPVLDPPDGRPGRAGGLAGQDGDGVDGQRLVGRTHGDDGRRLVLDGRHLQVGLGHGGAGHAQRGADVEAAVLLTDALSTCVENGNRD